MNISDVLFDTGKYDLRPPAREALARLSGIVVAHPGLKLQVEGYTDSVGGDGRGSSTRPSADQTKSWLSVDPNEERP